MQTNSAVKRLNIFITFSSGPCSAGGRGNQDSCPDKQGVFHQDKVKKCQKKSIPSSSYCFM